MLSLRLISAFSVNAQWKRQALILSVYLHPPQVFSSSSLICEIDSSNSLQNFCFYKLWKFYFGTVAFLSTLRRRMNAKSRGCGMWLIFGGRQKNTISFSRQSFSVYGHMGSLFIRFFSFKPVGEYLTIKPFSRRTTVRLKEALICRKRFCKTLIYLREVADFFKVFATKTNDNILLPGVICSIVLIIIENLCRKDQF